MNTNIIPSYFIPHGWGPWNLMWEEHMKMTWEIHLKKYLNNLWEQYKNVDAIIMITAHWESSDIAISFVEDYHLLYDYYGFPNNTYQVDYKVKWDLNFSKKVENLLNTNWIKTSRDTTRWLDHGSFVPLMEMFPKITIPVIQVSISKNLDASFHYKLWEALASLKKENILILGSWMSYHNMRWFFSSDPKYRNDSIAFNKFLEKNINTTEVLLNWNREVLSKEVHPRPEHFIPFFTILWTKLDGEITQDIKMDNYGKEIVGYKVC